MVKKMLAYNGKILKVDLSTSKFEELEIDKNIFYNFIGGSGVGARLFFDYFTPQNEAFSPQNPLIIMTGPLTGSNYPGCSTRFSIVSRSPLTGIWGESSCGGNFGIGLKSTGFDGLIIQGISDKPVYLLLDNDKISLVDAISIWGKDTYDVDSYFKEVHGKNVKSLIIGKAGEKLVKFACIMNDNHNAAGRCGLGAVMGSKKLKAIAVIGSQKVKFADEQKIVELRKTLIAKIKENITSQSLSAFGSDAAMDLGMMTGDVPIKNWTMGRWDEGAENLSGPKMADTILKKTKSCFGCPVGCKRVVEVKEGDFIVPEGAGPEYETVAVFGTLCLNKNLASVAKAGELCNRYGMDTISCGATIAFAMECFENGLITIKDTDGIDLSWGNSAGIIKLIEKIGNREGFGDLLSLGSKGAALKIGKGAEKFTVEVKGLEAPMHDPRAFHGLGLAYATSNRGACHVNSLTMWVEQGFSFYPQIGLDTPFEGQSSQGKALLNVKTQDFGSIFNSACICFFAAVPFDENDILNMINSTTGFNYDINSLMKAGERIWILKRSINNMLGINSSADRLPNHILTPIASGPTAGSIPDISTMLEEYYPLRGLSKEGIPLKEKLVSLGLDFLIPKLY